ncbi:4-alpha-glucanotransferase [Gammaproteobacteria bacterium AB-CW1]|uniref:4-alpha-glucanotransferase n=1 Tax=Natronospira elongata TaxID=3110268 RepID=A0AAP6JFC6_9GAMM|nr:4-alpha-glucanotransferase [Gammaproteobacteria bacterium AB-CW1]
MDRNFVFGRRRAGVLLHPTSLPGPGPVGTLGKAAMSFIDFLSEAGVSVWQTLPLLPVNESASPYQPYSLFAGNTALIDAEQVAEDFDLPSPGVGAAGPELITAAMSKIRHQENRAMGNAFEAFRHHHREWLHPWCQFQALHCLFRGTAWPHWPASFRHYEPDPVLPLDNGLQDAMDREAFCQFLFHQQWRRLKTAANRRGIALYGDLPFYPAADSADTWQYPQYFDLDEFGHPKRIAGVPPDAFSETGQSWGMPVYDWTRLQNDGFGWWQERLMNQLELFDILRLDHFRGLEACWSHPPDAEAADGEWTPVPGEALLRQLHRTLGDFPLVAEDLGHITAAVEQLRDQFALPGMRILQFGFDGSDGNPHHPDNHDSHCLVYSGTHDNNTLMGWWSELAEDQRDRVLAALSEQALGPEQALHWRLVNCCLESLAQLSVIPMQDLLGLGSEARMNTPGTMAGNWSWRMSGKEALSSLAPFVRQRVTASGRDGSTITPQSTATRTATPSSPSQRDG